MPDYLKLLRPEGRVMLLPEQYLQGLPDSISELCEPFEGELPRTIDLAPLDAVLTEAMKRYQDEPERSDGWLSPRVHATLRLFRREAADRRLWNYLSIRFRSYIIWRWKTAKGLPEERVIGPTNRHALARLWWLAELVRRGDDYTLVEHAFRLQETAQWILDVDAFQNKPAALAYVRYLGDASDGNTARQVAKSLNHALTTVVLDALAPDAGPNMDDLEGWIRALPDETTMYTTLPVGPGDDQIDEAVIQELERLLGRLRPLSATVRREGGRSERRVAARANSG